MRDQISSQDRFSSVTRGRIKLKSKPASYFKVAKKKCGWVGCWGEGGWMKESGGLARDVTITPVQLGVTANT